MSGRNLINTRKIKREEQVGKGKSLCLQVKQERIRANIRFIEQRGKRFSMQSIKDNVSLLDEETVNKINEVVARRGISYLKKGGS